MPFSADRQHVVRGIRTSTAHNTTAFGYSLAVAASFAALMKEHGEPSWAELFLYLVGACLGFAVVNALSTHFYREEAPDEPEVVISLATSLSVFSVCASVAAATGIAFALDGWLAWLLGAVAFTLTYLVAVGAEIGLAAHQHSAGGTEGERRRSKRRS